jgi:phosphotransferase system HPr (HPr) family protein
MNRDRVIRLVTVANRFASHVMLEREDSSVNGKSMLGLLSITGINGRDYMLVTSGEDEREALEQVSALLEEEDQTE